jgi:acyl-coenzyme A synthetase/AMP-(fatty) acid ligase
MDPHRPAVVLPDLVTTYAGLADAVDSISNRIDQLGLDPSEPVATAIGNPALTVAVAFALLRSGFSVAPANRGLIKHLQINGIRNLIYDVEGFVASGGRNIRFDNSWLPATPSGGRAWRRRPVGDVGVIQFTSGTTGLPKKFVLTRQGLDARMAAVRTTAEAAWTSVLMVPGIASAFAFNRTCELLHCGKTVCWAPTPEAMLQLIGLFRIDTMVASPQQALGLAAIKESNPELPVDSLQTILIAGGRIGREGVKRIRTALCRNVINEYASTEGGVVATAPFDLIDGIAGAAGFILPWAELQIVNEAGESLPDDQNGIIRIRTPQFLGNIVPKGSDPVTEHWFYPGDMGHLTDNGILCLTGRTSDIINTGGTKLSARRVEEILETIEGVREAAACGVEDAAGMERLWVAVVANGTVNSEALKAKVQAHPDVGANLSELFVLPELPRGDSGKVQKPRLKEILLDLSRRV